MNHHNALRGDPTLMSQPDWRTQRATEAGLRYLAPRLTQDYLTEIDALSRFQPVSVLLQNMERKMVITDSRNPSQPLALLEFAPLDGRPAAGFWSALAEKAIQPERYWSLTEYTRRLLNSMGGMYPTLLTHVDARNLTRIEWLERVGFHHVEDIPEYGRKGLPFKLFSRHNASS